MEYIENTFKMRNKPRRNITCHELKGRRPIYQVNQGLVTWSKKAKTKVNHLQIMSNFIGPIKKPTRRRPPKLGSIGVRLG